MSMLTLTINVKEVKADAGSKIIYVDDDNVSGPWYGNQTHPYQNITSGLEHASNGDTIFVYNGTYSEDVNVNKSVWLKGENRSNTTINGSGTADVIDVTVDNVTISSFAVNNGAVYAIYVYSQSEVIYGVRVENCTVQNNGIGIFLHNVNNGTVQGNTVIGGSLSSIALRTCSHINITYNELSNVTLKSGHAIDINASDNIRVAYNTMKYNEGDGVYLSTDEGEYCDITICNNVMSHNMYGVKLFTRYQAYPATITENNITNNEYAVYHSSLGENPMCCPHNFYNNNFINNTYNKVTFYGGETFTHNWNSCYPTCGNYWSNYTGADFYRGTYQNESGDDGVVDDPYTMDQNNTDAYPFLHPYAELVVKTKYQEEDLYNVSIWIDGGDELLSTVNMSVGRELHTIQAQSRFIVWIDEFFFYKYTFDHWEDDSTANPREVSMSIDETFTAYYRRKMIGVQK